MEVGPPWATRSPDSGCGDVNFGKMQALGLPVGEGELLVVTFGKRNYQYSSVPINSSVLRSFFLSVPVHASVRRLQCARSVKHVKVVNRKPVTSFLISL